MSNQEILSGASGLFGGGKPVTDPDNLISNDTMEFTLGLCEGPIAGLVNGPVNFYFDDTPLVSPSGQNNFNPFELHLYHGDALPSKVVNVLGGVTSNYSIGVNLVQNTPVIRTTTSSLRNQIDFLEIRINFGQIFESTPKGDQLEYHADFELQYREAGTIPWSNFYANKRVVISGKTTGGYTKDFVKGVPRINNDWEIRLMKLSPDNDPRFKVSLAWESYQAVTAEDRRYNNLAVIRGLGQASDQFSSIPTFSGVYATKIVKVPSNYNPLTRYYNGLWDGTFKDAHTDNPAWVVYDILTNDVYGCRAHWPELLVDRFSFYTAAQWCDEFVPVPGGGFQPRYTYNEKLSQKQTALELIYYILAIFHAVPVTDLNGTIRVKLDKSGIPVQLYGLESITPEGFQYQFSDITSRVNDITVSFINPNLDWGPDFRQVTDQTLVAAKGRIPEEMSAIGCNNVHEAQRRAYRRILQANTEITTVSFQTARSSIALEIYDLIGIVDPTMNWGLSGRVKSRSGTTITLRDTMYIPVNTDLVLSIQSPSGITELIVRSTTAATKTLVIKSGTWPADAPTKAQFGLTATTLGLVKPFRILSATPSVDNPELVTIMALEHNPNKDSDADNLITSPSIAYDYQGASYPETPTILSVESGTQQLFINSDGRISPRIKVTWNQNPGSFTRDFDILYRLRGRDPFQRVRTRGVDVMLDNILEGGVYEIKIVAINAIGRSSRPSPVTLHKVIGKTAPPENVIGFTAVQVGPNVHLDFTGVGDLDLAHYQIKRGTTGDTWNSATNIGVTTTVNFVDLGIKVSPAIYFVKAVDTTGHRSLVAASVTHLVPAPGVPVGAFQFDKAQFVVRMSPNTSDVVPSDRFIITSSGLTLFEGKASQMVAQTSWLGNRTFEITNINVAGLSSPIKSVMGTVIAPAAPTLSLQLSGENYQLSWTPNLETLPVDYYIVKDTTSGVILESQLRGTTFTTKAEWLGSNSFSVTTVDTAGNTSPAASSSLTITTPIISNLVSTVSNSLLKLMWVGNKTSLPIRTYQIHSGGILLGTVNAETFSFPVTWNGTKTFKVRAIDSAGNIGPQVAVIETIDPPLQPMVIGKINGQHVSLNWSGADGELRITSYEIWKQYSGDVAKVFIQSVQATGVTFPAAHLGDGTFFVRAIDEAGNIGPYGSVLINIAAPGVFMVSALIDSNLASLSWTAPVATLPIKSYDLRRGGTWATSTLVTRTSTSDFSFPADWAGVETFFVEAVDTAGNKSLVQSVDLEILAPTSPTPRSEVIDNNVLLRWSNGVGTLPVVATEIRKGLTFATAIVQQKVDATFATFFEFNSGDYTYWLVEIDSAGNYGNPISITTPVSQPPDYLLQTNFNSSFTGTKSQIIINNEGHLLMGLDPLRTYAEHFLVGGFNTPQNQIDIGYPLYIQPIDHLVPSFYQEELDIGGVILASIITVTPTLQILAGDGAVSIDIEFKEFVGDPWILHADQTKVYAQNFQFVRFTIRLTANSYDDLLMITGINVLINVKIRNDAGSGVALASDASGTQVTFNVNFVDVAAINVTPNTTIPVTAVYDFLDTQNPTSFLVYLFDKNGVRVTGNFSWAVRGF